MWIKINWFRVVLSVFDFIGTAVEDERRHFLLAFSVGAWGFWLISTILSALLRAWENGTRRRASSAVVYSIPFISFLVGGALALLSHVWLDGLYSWFMTPLGPSLELH